MTLAVTHKEMDLARSRLDLVGSLKWMIFIAVILQVFMFVCDTYTTASWATLVKWISGFALISVIPFVHHLADELRLLEKVLGNIGWNDEADAALSWL